PPLRDRVEDIELLADHFLAAVNARDGSQKRLSAEARTRLVSYRWPGNVRELKNAVERAAILADTTVGPALLPGAGSWELSPSPDRGATLKVTIGSSAEEVERRLILATLAHHGGDKKEAARTLGISLKTLYARLKVYQAAGHATPEPEEGLHPGPDPRSPAEVLPRKGQ